MPKNTAEALNSVILISMTSEEAWKPMLGKNTDAGPDSEAQAACVLRQHCDGLEESDG